MIDLACGTGAHALLQAHGGTRVLGIDLSPAMVRQAQARARAAGKRVQVVQGDMRTFDAAKPVDAVTCLYASLNHLDGPRDLARTFARAAAHLRPGGVFVFDLNTQTGFETLWRRSVTEQGPGFTLHRSFQAQGRRTIMRLCIERPGCAPLHDQLTAAWFDPRDVRAALRSAGLTLHAATSFNPFPNVPGDGLKELWTAVRPSSTESAA